MIELENKYPEITGTKIEAVCVILTSKEIVGKFSRSELIELLNNAGLSLKHEASSFADALLEHTQAQYWPLKNAILQKNNELGNSDFFWKFLENYMDPIRFRDKDRYDKIRTRINNVIEPTGAQVNNRGRIFTVGLSSDAPKPVVGIPKMPFLLVDFEDLLYRDLVSEINVCANAGAPTATYVLCRKLLENLVIDVLRSKFGKTKDGVKLFYEIDRKRFLDFHILIENLNLRKAEFDDVEKMVEKAVELLRKFRENANSSAHSVYSLSSIADLDEYKISELIKLLTGLINRTVA